jgi:hypothetical protein
MLMLDFIRPFGAGFIRSMAAKWGEQYMADPLTDKASGSAERV